VILGDSGGDRCSGLFGSVRVRDARVGAVSGSFCGKFSVSGRKKRKYSVLLEIVGIGGSILRNFVMVLAIFRGSDGRDWMVQHAEGATRGSGRVRSIAGSFRVRGYREHIY